MAGYKIDIREVEWVAHKAYLFPDVINQVFTDTYLSMPVKHWQIPYRASRLLKNGRRKGIGSYFF